MLYFFKLLTNGKIGINKGDPLGRLLHRLHHRGRGREDVEPRHSLLRGILAGPIQQVRHYKLWLQMCADRIIGVDVK